MTPAATGMDTRRDTAPSADDAGRPPLALPPALERQLADFRRTVWSIKALEAVSAAACGLVVAWLSLFVADRLMETPGGLRWGVFGLATAALAAVPFAFERWIWRYRSLDRLTRLVAGRFPSLGDQLLGIVEIVRNHGEQGRSQPLCAAAIRQVADASARHDLRQAVPRPRHKTWAAVAVALVAMAAAVTAAAPDAAANAWMRLLTPWRRVERFTFARVDALPRPLVVPHGEPVGVTVALRSDTRWRPGSATARVGRQAAVTGRLGDDGYRLELPAQVMPATLAVAVGDVRQWVPLVPTFRPHVEELSADVRLPAYLERPEPLARDARGGTVSVVRGSTVSLSAVMNRELESAEVDGVAVVPAGRRIVAPAIEAEASREIAVSWRDTLGLEAARPLRVNLAVAEDQPPAIGVTGLSGRGVLLETESVRFTIEARDDFGVKRVGLEWAAAGSGAAPPSADAEKGETLLAVGGPRQETLAAVGTVSPAAVGIRPQTVEVRLFAEDYLPGRGRTYSAPAVFVVMSAADHALWINDQIARWRQQTAEVRDRELSLLARNEELMRLSPEELDAAEQRKALREQAAAEQQNASRLGRLADSGAELVRQATRNPEFDADTLEQLAEHVQDLEAMARSRMPDIGALVRQAADAAKDPAGGRPGAEPSPGEGRTPAATAPQDGPPPTAGKTRPAAAEGQGTSTVPPPVPQVVDKETSAAAENPAASPQQGGGSSGGRLGLPTTSVGSVAGRAGKRADQAPQRSLLDAAVEKQRRLIEDFAKIAQRLGDVMARLEGTTFVKRLKSAARSQLKVGEDLAVVAARTFGGAAAARGEAVVERQITAATRGNEELEKKLSAIMDDMDAYGERRPLPAVRSVLEEMRQLDVLGSIRQVTVELHKETGVSIAQTEFWSDTLDRWADELVPPPQPGGDGGGGGGSPPESLPPEIVLEAMLILEAETNLREETRVAQQLRKGLDAADFATRAARLAADQRGLADRVGEMVTRLEDDAVGPLQFEAEIERMKREILPGGSRPRKFAREIAVFRMVQGVMADARRILASPETGRGAIAAETEAIELLLQAQFGGDGGGGGGGGTAPGGGGYGTTRQAALARLGGGTNRRARLEAPEENQAVGKTGAVLPAEFRDGLDAYFNAFERGRDAGEAKP